MKRTPKLQPSAITRRGFSLIELMVAIVIIGILMAMILPAIQAVQRRARLQSVTAEMTQLDSAIAKFKTAFNAEPPSSLHIPIAGSAWDAASRSKVRSIWPQFDFATNGGLGNTIEYHLNGAECLVFFLGGVQDSTTSPPIVTGFSKDPRTPWSAAGSNREGPFFEFEASRFIDVDGDGVLEFLDPLPDQRTPYLYFSSQGRVYNKFNAGGTVLADQDDFDVHGGPANTQDMSFIYLKNVKPNPSPPPTDLPGEPQRANSYQIISPGFDGQYGVGGVYSDGSELTGNRLAEADNITNFTNGVLKP